MGTKIVKCRLLFVFLQMFFKKKSNFRHFHKLSLYIDNYNKDVEYPLISTKF